ncbi:MAG: cysteine--tRNA ligase [Planctomycetaceae bacterium]|jgi:cysteinyl-tRNA synthetase|nr:cysteine--tRNA ligase [Planctomycetaceae bacterium]
MIRVYNTLSKSKEEFQTVTPGKVGMYLCGPTVYKPSHIGHMVGPVIFDAIKRYLIYNGYDVTFVINITDVDDKLIAESNARGIPMPQVAEEMTADYMRNLDAMGVRDNIDHFPKATEYMQQIIDFTQTLIDKGFAYPADGDVYFDVQKVADYGKLSHRNLEQMLGEGGSTAEQKHSPFDFALWKSAKPNEPSWTSPWGKGRPGWHIECSVMSGSILGKTFDIHGGGLDLVFPHHENEIAQSESRYGCLMAKYWMHNGLMQASNEAGKVGGRNTREANTDDLQPQEEGKISKSKGASAFRDMLQEFDAENIRFFLLSTHYRRPIDYSIDRLKEVGTALDTFYRFFKRHQRITNESFYQINAPIQRKNGDIDSSNNEFLQSVAEQRNRFLEAMDDDFNTGGAIGVLFDLLRLLNKFADDNKLETDKPDAEKIQSLKRAAMVLRELALTLGLFRNPPKEKVSSGDTELVGKLIELLIELRAASRKAKDFTTADKIRNGLTEIGVTLEDRPTGTEWIMG